MSADAIGQFCALDQDLAGVVIRTVEGTGVGVFRLLTSADGSMHVECLVGLLDKDEPVFQMAPRCEPP